MITMARLRDLVSLICAYGDAKYHVGRAIGEGHALDVFHAANDTSAARLKAVLDALAEVSPGAREPEVLLTKDAVAGLADHLVREVSDEAAAYVREWARGLGVAL